MIEAPFQNAVYYLNRLSKVKTVQQLTNFAQVHQYLRRFHDQAHTKYNLDNMLRLMDFLDNPQNKFRVVHVAGTSGKTSTAYYMSALLAAAGCKVGLTVSPHVDGINERVQINIQPLSEPEFCRSISVFLGLIEAAPVKPSWFELMVAFAYWYFAKAQVDYAVVEVGLGGLKDGTNVITRSDKVCVITDIGYDHINILGKTLSEIAEQKAGIIHDGNAVFTYQQPAKIMAELHKRPGEIHVVDEAANPSKTVPDYQFRNGFLAYSVYLFLQKRDGLPHLGDDLLDAISNLSVPGRMDAIKIGQKTVVFDGAHNVQKMEAFAASFCKLYPGVKPAILLAMRTGKEYKAVVPILADLASHIIVTTFETTQDLPVKSLPPKDLARALPKQLPVEVIEDHKTAFQALLSLPGNVCVVTGSLYLLGQIRNNDIV